MPKPNNEFNLSVIDLSYIEKALRYYQFDVDVSEKRQINELLGRLHSQKVWYRPKNKTYVSG